VIAQRFIAVLLTLLLVALVMAIFVLVFSAAGHTGLGWVIGALFVLLMGYGGLRARGGDAGHPRR
jgi:hypothetical protein